MRIHIMFYIYLEHKKFTYVLFRSVPFYVEHRIRAVFEEVGVW
jgi:hypothetical protein